MPTGNAPAAVVERLKRRKIMLEKRKKREVTIEPRGGVFPKRIAGQYEKDLDNLLNELASIVDQLFFKSNRVEKIKATADRELNRKDAYDDDIEELLEQLNLRVSSQLSDDALIRIAERNGIEVNEKNMAILRSQYKTVTGFDIFAQEAWLRPKLKAFTRENVRLITNMRDDYLRKVESTIFRGVTRGQSLKDIREGVQKNLKVSKNRAKLIARDQVASLNGELTKVRQQDAGVQKYRWSTSGDERVRDEHEQNNGKIFSWADPPSTGHPGEDINCRCIAIPIFSSIK